MVCAAGRVVEAVAGRAARGVAGVGVVTGAVGGAAAGSSAGVVVSWAATGAALVVGSGASLTPGSAAVAGAVTVGSGAGSGAGAGVGVGAVDSATVGAGRRSVPSSRPVLTMAAAPTTHRQGRGGRGRRAPLVLNDRQVAVQEGRVVGGKWREQARRDVAHADGERGLLWGGQGLIEAEHAGNEWRRALQIVQAEPPCTQALSRP